MKNMYVYILECCDGSYYTGVTNNVDKRLIEHQNGIEPTCYTYSRRPVKLVFYEMFNDPLQSIAFEKQVKGWSRAKKKAIIEDNWEKLKELAKCKNESSHQFFEKN